MQNTRCTVKGSRVISHIPVQGKRVIQLYRKKKKIIENHRGTEWLKLEGTSEDHSVPLSCKSSTTDQAVQGLVWLGVAHLQGCTIHRLQILLYSVKPTCTWHKFRFKMPISQHFAPLSSKFWQWYSFPTIVWGVSTEEEKEISLTVATKSIS